MFVSTEALSHRKLASIWNLEKQETPMAERNEVKGENEL
jgi:hypothetical protein